MPRIDIVFVYLCCIKFCGARILSFQIAAVIFGGLYDYRRLVHRQATKHERSPSKCKLGRRNKHVPTCICLRFFDLYWPWIIQHVSCILRGGYELRSRGIIDWHKHILNVIAFGMISFGFHFWTLQESKSSHLTSLVTVVHRVRTTTWTAPAEMNHRCYCILLWAR